MFLLRLTVKLFYLLLFISIYLFYEQLEMCRCYALDVSAWRAFCVLDLILTAAFFCGSYKNTIFELMISYVNDTYIVCVKHIKSNT